MTTEKYLIYGLTEPETSEVRYVGKSSCGLQRPRRHWLHRQTRERRDHCHNWVRSVLARDKEPGVVVLESLQPGRDIKRRLNIAESAWISKLRAEGARLTNLTDGGDGFTSPMPDVIRQRVSAGCKASYTAGRVPWTKLHGHDEKARAKISAAGLGRKQSVTTREKRSASLRHRYGAVPKPGRKVIDRYGNTYVSLEQASRMIGIPSSTLRKHMSGFGLRFVDG